MSEPSATNEGMAGSVFTDPPLERPSSWPVAIGVIAIVFGVGGMLGGLFGMLAPVFNKLMASLDPNQAAVYEAQAKYAWLGVAVSVVSLAVAAWLLWGGVTLLKRRPAAGARLKNWATAKIVLVVVLAGYQAVILPASMDASFQAQQQQSGAVMPEIFTQAIVIFSVVTTLLWGGALPIFVLIWFGRKKIKAEVASWADDSSDRLAPQTHV
ncbi:MAG: hypothetical protein AAGH99_04760 [Planctomycetota bacterium]